MRERTDELAAGRWRVSRGQVVRASVVLVALSVLVVASVSGEFGRGAATVGFVLTEALALYAGYGILMRVARPAASEILVSA